MTGFDHIIVGGGVIGCSIAYHLAREGAGRILLLERGELANAASSRAAGLVLQVTGKPVNGPLVRATHDAIGALEAELGEAVGFHPVGSLRIAAAPARQAELRGLAEEAARQGVPCEDLEPAAARARVPWLELPAGSRALFMPGDGYLDPYLLTMAYARAARARGVAIRPRSAVTGTSLEGARVVGVEVEGEAIAGAGVIDAAGAWSALLAQQAGFALPMAPVRSHYWICEPEPGFGGDHPMTLLADAAAYTRPETGGLLLGLQEPRSKTFDARTLPDDMAAFSPTAGEEHWEILAAGADAVAPFFPGVMTARFSSYIAGLSAYTPDGAILLGTLPGIEGFLVAAGCCGNGVALSGGIGALVSDLALGKRPRWDINAFDPGRFGAVDPFDPVFRARCATARATKSRHVRP